MSAWYWLLGALILLGVVGGLYLLDRLGLWLEEHGWLYYRKKRPSSSPAGMWIGLHQYLEPGVKHVRTIGEERKKEEDKATKERLLTCLQACLEAEYINPEEIRLYLDAAQRAGLNWKNLYADAVQVQLSLHPHSAAPIPPTEDVAPDTD